MALHDKFDPESEYQEKINILLFFYIEIEDKSVTLLCFYKIILFIFKKYFEV